MKTKVFFTLLFMSMLGQVSIAQNEYDLTPEQRETIEQRVREKINDFLSYLPEIAAKSDKSIEEKQLALKYIDKSLDLFIGEGKKYQYQDQTGIWRWHDAVKMQTTSRGRIQAPRPMKTYLKHLMALPYKKVEIDTCQAVRINRKLHKTGDGRYTGSAVFVQAFRATRDGRLVVNDIDGKQVTIYVERKIIEGPSGQQEVWIIKLGDIRIITNY